MKTMTILAVFGLALSFLFIRCAGESAQAASADSNNVKTREEIIARGKYLVSTSGCDDCHTPKVMTPHGPEPDMSRRMMGHPVDEVFSTDNKKALIKKENVAVFSAGMTAAAGPWGVSYASNLSPDDTGTGNWTEAQFIKAIREGKSKGLDGARPLLPPMPWQQYAQMNDDDLKAIFAYIQTLKPVSNVVPNPKTL